MPKIFEYVGILVFFYSNEHEPIHVHAKYNEFEIKAEFHIVDGNLNWNDYDLIFPVYDLYVGQI